GAGLDGIRSEGATDARPVAIQAVAAPPLFSDLHQWLLKVVLAPHFPAEELGAPERARAGSLSTATELARVAGGSIPSASRFVIRLDAEGFLRSRKGPIALVRVGELLDQWRTALAAERPEATRTRWVLPARDPIAQLGEAAAKAHRRAAQDRSVRVALGL